jgi:hypothetical protein
MGELEVGRHRLDGGLEGDNLTLRFSFSDSTEGDTRWRTGWRRLEANQGRGRPPGGPNWAW